MSIGRYGSFVLILVTVGGLALSAHAQAPVITSFDRNGVLEWTNARSNGWYGVEWASTLTGAWHYDWSSLTLIAPTGSTMRAHVPQYYRVVWRSDPPSTPVVGEILATADESSSSYNGILDNTPIIPGSLVINGGSLTWTDDGDGTLSGTAGVDGTIVYETGAWSIDLKSNRIADGELLSAAYRYGFASPPNPPPSGEVSVTGEILATADFNSSSYNGVLDSPPIVAGSLVINGGTLTWTDNGNGTLSGTAGVNGTIVYKTGAWSIDLQSNRIADGELLSAAYRYHSGGYGDASILVTDKLVAYGVSGRSVYSGTINNTPLESFSITIYGTGFLFTDNGHGVLQGTLGTTGTVNYTTGEWRIDLKGYEFPAGSPVLANYRILLAR